MSTTSAPTHHSSRLVLVVVALLAAAVAAAVTLFVVRDGDDGGAGAGVQGSGVTASETRSVPAFDAVLLNTKVVSLKESKDGITVTLEGAVPEGTPRERTFDRVLVAVGRKPNSRVPGLDRTRVTVGPRGFIEIDEARRTAEPSIFAIGDVVGEPMLAHKASHEARVAVDAILGERVAFEPLAIPAVVFTDLASGSCLFAVLKHLRTLKDVKVVTGVNLAMLVDFVFHVSLDAEAAAEHAMAAGTKAIRTP